MPYDPKNNSGIDRDFSRNASQETFKVVGVDTFDGTDWPEGEFSTLDEAIKHADGQVEGKSMLKMYVYNDKGRCVHSAGSF